MEKTLYGLKQSPKAWFDRFTKAIRKMGCCQSRGDHTLFRKHCTNVKVTAYLVQVDDIIVTGDETTMTKGTTCKGI